VKRTIASIALLLAILACSLPGSGGGPLPELQSPAPEVLPTSSLEGLAFSNPPLSGTLPTLLGSGVQSLITTEIELPYINPSAGEMPQHTKYVIDGYPFGGSIHQPQIIVFSAAEYAGYSELTALIISAARSARGFPGGSLPPEFPTGPIFAQAGGVNFKNGYGLRYLTQFDQAPLPINNSGLFYYFHGMTEDGQYYLTAVLPVSAPFLVNNDDPASPFPADAIPFDWNNFDTLPQYFDSVTQQLNSATPDTFLPRLSDLDALIGSLGINLP
jgi:hypothetical protein